jgi:hypothetical protein
MVMVVVMTTSAMMMMVVMANAMMVMMMLGNAHHLAALSELSFLASRIGSRGGSQYGECVGNGFEQLGI